MLEAHKIGDEVTVSVLDGKRCLLDGPSHETKRPLKIELPQGVGKCMLGFFSRSTQGTLHVGPMPISRTWLYV